MSGRIFDNDVTAPSNLNRNMLTIVADVGEFKVTEWKIVAVGTFTSVLLTTALQQTAANASSYLDV
jgi:hypothetical protein